LQSIAEETYGFSSSATGGQSMANNLLKIQIYFKSLIVQNVVESPTYLVSYDIVGEKQASH
jgi:hypothetical protein